MSNDHESEKSQSADSSVPTKKSNKNIWALLVIFILIVGALYGLGFLQVLRSGWNAQAREGVPVFHKVNEALFSSDDLMTSIGAGALDPTKLNPVQEKSILAEVEKKPDVCLPTNVVGGLNQETAGEPSLPSSLPQIAQISSNDAPSHDQPNTQVAASTQKVDEIEDRDVKQVSATKTEAKQIKESKDKANVSSDKLKALESESGPKMASKDSGSGKGLEKIDEENKKAEEFQLPGSLTVKIRGYHGSIMKWRLMVIYDDSSRMDRRIKSWKMSKHNLAETFITKLPGSLTPGSKLAVRDFHCGKNEAKTKKACLSRMVYDWADAPYSDLKDKVHEVKPGGRNNPCAALAYSLKKDFPASGDHAPRLVVITEGLSKCAYTEALEAVEDHKDKNKIAIDLILMGAQKKKHNGYSALAKRTGGIIIHIDNPGDLESAVAKYAKALKAKTMEKIEIRGDRTVYSALPEEEITLAPGSYDLVLPQVAGITLANRHLNNVRIGPGEAKVMDIRVKKGKIRASQ